MRKQNTKHSLIMSAIALLLCFSMLLGTTFAWFTDSVTSSNNIIKSGTLDVSLEWFTGEDAVPGVDSLDWMDASNDAIFNYTLWEPGFVQARHIKIENEGSLALKYKVTIEANGEKNDELFKLAEVIDVYYVDPAQQIADREGLANLPKLGTLAEVLGKLGETGNGELAAGANDTITIALKMQESAGNEYQGLAENTTFSVKLFATQLTAEEDSFDETYDKDSMYADENGLYLDPDTGVYTALSTADLVAVAKAASANETIEEVVFEGETVPVVRNGAELDEAVKDSEDVIVLTDGDFVMPVSAQNKTLTIVGADNTNIVTHTSGSYEGCNYNLQGANVTFENITITTDNGTFTGYANMIGTYNNCTINNSITLYGDSVFNNCTLNVSGDQYNIWTWSAPNVTLNNCTINSDGKALLLYGGTKTKLTVNNCVFNDTGVLPDLKAAIEIGSDYGTSIYELIVNDTTVNGYEINDKGINTGTTLWGNKNSIGQDKLNVVVDGVDVY